MLLKNSNFHRNVSHNLKPNEVPISKPRTVNLEISCLVETTEN